MKNKEPMPSKSMSFQATTSIGIALMVISFTFMHYLNDSQNMGIKYIFVVFSLPILFLSSIFIFFKSLFLLFEIESTNNDVMLFLVYLISIFISIWYILPPMETPFFI